MYPSQFPVGFKEIRLQELPSSCFRVVQCFFPPFTFGLTRLNIVPSMYPLFRKNPISKNLPILAATSNINRFLRPNTQCKETDSSPSSRTAALTHPSRPRVRLRQCPACCHFAAWRTDSTRRPSCHKRPIKWPKHKIQSSRKRPTPSMLRLLRIQCVR